MHPEIRKAMRSGSYDDLLVMAYHMAGEPLRPNVCNRTFNLYVGNGFVDPSRNTAAGAQDVATCERFLRGRCYRQFHGGQMEQVLDDLICISYIHTPAAVLSLVRKLREFGIIGEIRCEVEYVEGFPVDLKSF